MRKIIFAKTETFSENNSSVLFNIEFRTADMSDVSKILSITTEELTELKRLMNEKGTDTEAAIPDNLHRSN
jgi:hypothetical protein